MRRALVLALVALATASPRAVRADIWSYTDASGTIHFTNIEPSGKKRRKWKKLYETAPSGKAAARRGRCERCDTVPARDQSPERFTRYDEYIREAAALYQIPEALIRAVIKVESDYDPRVVSYVGARGLMQLMPGTASDMRVSDPHDPRQSIFGGTRYLRVLANQFEGDMVLVLAAYQCGPANVARYGDIPPFKNTRTYVKNVLRHYYRFKQKVARR